MDDDFEQILMCAVRYAMGRKTYIVSFCTDYVKKLLPNLSNKTLEVIKRDIDFMKECELESEWYDLRNCLSTELENRLHNKTQLHESKKENKTTLYISGKITGDKNYKAKFAKAEKKLQKKGFNVINPCDIGEHEFLTYEQFLHIDFALIDVCDGIYMLKDWKDSNGARLELEHAIKLGKKIIHESEVVNEKE